jgi:hypothetical protein
MGQTKRELKEKVESPIYELPSMDLIEFEQKVRIAGDGQIRGSWFGIPTGDKVLVVPLIADSREQKENMKDALSFMIARINPDHVYNVGSYKVHKLDCGYAAGRGGCACGGNFDHTFRYVILPDGSCSQAAFSGVNSGAAIDGYRQNIVQPWRGPQIN